MIAQKTKTRKIVLSGANGFVGSGVIDFLAQQSVDLHVLHRRPWQKPKPWLTTHLIRDFNAQPEAVIKASKGADVFIHLAGRAHQSGDKKDYDESIVHLTETLISCAAKAGVKRFIYISTILVHGTVTGDEPFNENSPPNPQNWYAASKWKAEQSVKRLAIQYGIDYVIIRPPLVYGPGVKGNLKKLLLCIKSGLPIPLKNVGNKRSLMSLENLSSLIWQCSVDKRATNQIYVAADNNDVSTDQIMSYFAQGMGKKARLFFFPPRLIKLFLRMLGQQKMIDQLFGSLQVDSSKSRYQLGWIPIKPTAIAMPEATRPDYHS